MYLGAQRVIDDSGPSVTLYLYLHGHGLPTSHRAMLSDVRWISQLAPGQLARERHEGKAGGRSIVSYLEVSGPDETDIGSLRGVLDALNEHVAAGGKEPIVKGAWGADFFCGAETGRAPLEELGNLRVRLEQFFEDGGTMPPDRDLTIEVSRAEDMTFFRWDGESYDKLAVEAPAGWRPFRFSISDEVRDAFERQHGVLFPHVMEVLRPGDEVDLEALGGVAFKDESTRKVLWFSPRKVG